jgi:hypothetical protein
MTDPDPPAQLKDAKGRFLPGNRSGRGRPKGSPNQFGPGFREKLLAGIARSGTKKAKKAGVNHKVDGLEYFVESLVDSNGGAAATLIAKLIPPEQPPEFSGSPLIVNVRPVAEGNQFAPGNKVLLPCESCAEAWQAYRSGEEAWQAFLKEIEPQLTKAAFENLSLVVPPEPDNVVNLRNRKPDNDENDDDVA